MRTQRVARAFRCASLAALLGLAGCQAAGAASAAAAAADVLAELLAPAAPVAAAPSSPMQAAIQGRAEQRATRVAQAEARRHGWPGMSVLESSFVNGRWEISLQRLPRMPNGHAVVLVSAEGELLDFSIEDA